MAAKRDSTTAPPIWVDDFTLEERRGYFVAFVRSGNCVIPLEGDEKILRRFAEVAARLLARRAAACLGNVVHLRGRRQKH